MEFELPREACTPGGRRRILPRPCPCSEGWPPFLIVCDVGHCFEIFADFTGQGKNYAQFPDRQGFHIYLEDLRIESDKPTVNGYFCISRTCT
jgi:hypothetical protein